MEPMNSNTGSVSDGGVADRVRAAASSQLSTQKDRATDTLGSLANAIRQSTRTFRDEQQDTVASYVERAADQIERLSAALRNRDVNRLLHDTQQFARRQPAVFIGAAFATGLLAARFLKSSARGAGNDRWQERDTTPDAGRGIPVGTGAGTRRYVGDMP